MCDVGGFFEDVGGGLSDLVEGVEIGRAHV